MSVSAWRAAYLYAFKHGSSWLLADQRTGSRVRPVTDAYRRPVFDRADEELVYDLFTELLDTKQVSDATYARAIALFGESKLVELIAIFGHYNHVATVLNTFRVPVPPGWAEPLRD